MNGGVRWIDFEGAVNVRDVGGMPTADGGKTLPGRLLRSDNLQGLTPRDVTKLVEGHGLRTVIDLRTTGEVASEGPGPLTKIGSIRHTHHSMLPEAGAATDAAAETFAKRRERILATAPHDVVCAIYLRYLADRPDSVVNALRTIADTDGAAIVHCAAGKDRTGVVVALALSVAGVTQDAIVADYAATSQRIAAILARLRSSPTYATDVDRLPEDAHTPREHTMTSFLGHLDTEHGGVLGWLEENGFGDADATRLRQRLLAS